MIITPKNIIILVALMFLSGCAPYLAKARPALDAYYRGDFAKAAEYIRHVHARKADKLLSYLDKGTIFHSVQNYERSIRYFSKAADLADEYQRQAIAAQAGAVLTNDNVLPYIADPYERLLIHVYLMMDYAALGDLPNALVEVRRINTIFPDIYSDGEKRKFMQSTGAAYLSGLIWELNDLCNDAYIDYRRVEKLKIKPSGLRSDIERSAICAGLKSGVGNSPRPNLLIVFEAGRAPIKRSSEYQSALQIVPVPEYESRATNIVNAAINIDGHRLGRTEVLENMETSLKEALDDKMPGIVARAMARLAAKEAAAIAVGKKVDKTLGEFLAIAVLATNQADLRSWRTLPETLQIWRGRVAPGRHTILLEFLDKSGREVNSLSQEVTIEDGESRVMTVRVIL